jgi:hypothetical protein
VTFRSAKFNTRQSRPNYINPQNYGDDLAEWLKEKLSARSAVVDQKIGQEDFGWWLSFRFNRRVYNLVVGYNASGYWMAWLERKRGLIGSLLGLRQKGISGDVANLIHAVLVSSEIISDVRWHEDKGFDVHREEHGKLTPL